MNRCEKVDNVSRMFGSRMGGGRGRGGWCRDALTKRRRAEGRSAQVKPRRKRGDETVSGRPGLNLRAFGLGMVDRAAVEAGVTVGAVACWTVLDTCIEPTT